MTVRVCRVMTICAGMAALLLAVAGPLPSTGDVVLKAMRDELARSMEKLRLENLDKPYFISYAVREVSASEVTASFGSLLGSTGPNRNRILAVELRVGDATLDNTNFLSLSFGTAGVSRLFGGTTQIPVEDNYAELRREIWLATDSAYKKAIEDISKKRAALQNKTRAEEILDFATAAPADISEVTAPASLERAQAETLVQELSALFREMPDVFSSDVRLSVQNVHTRYVNSEGTTFVRSAPQVTLLAQAETQAPDGMPLYDFLLLYGRSMDDLPPKAELAGRIRALGENLARLRQAPLAENYNGPVLMEGQAAAELFGRVFGPKLLATRRPVSDNPQFEMMSAQMGNPFLDRIGARVLPRTFSVTDDPTAERFGTVLLVGGSKVDDEGIPTQPTKLVEGGILKTLLATRNPVRGVTHSTGSRRGGGPAPSNLIVTAEEGRDDKELRAELLKLAQQRGSAYAIVIRRVANPTLMITRDPMSLMRMFNPMRGEASEIGGVILAYKLYADGREELIRNVEASGLTVAAFREIVAASKSQAVSSGPFFSLGGGGFPFAFAGLPDPMGTPVSLVVPSLLFEELNLKKPAGEVPKPPVVTHPYFEKGRESVPR